MKGILFGDKHSFEDWNMYLTSKDIATPEPKTNNIEIPGADGVIDLTEILTGDVKYKNRKLTFQFATKRLFEAHLSIQSKIANYLHGKKLKIIIDDDKSFYYIGRCTVNKFESDKSLGKLVIEVDAEPYKYDIQSSKEDWIWDTFSFEDGIVNMKTDNISISGEQEVIIWGRRKKVSPEIVASTDMEVEFKGNIYNLSKGKNKIIDIQIEEGENILKFIGEGIVSIDYRGGSL